MKGWPLLSEQNYIKELYKITNINDASPRQKYTYYIVFSKFLLLQNRTLIITY